jgi:hypothetical protein
MTKSKKMRWAGSVARIGAKRNAYKILVGKSQEERPLRRTRRRWVDEIKIDLSEIRLGDMDWIDLARNRYQWKALLNTIMNFGFHKMSGNC